MPIPIRHDDEEAFPVPDPPEKPVGLEATEEDVEFPVPDPPEKPVG